MTAIQRPCIGPGRIFNYKGPEARHRLASVSAVNRFLIPTTMSIFMLPDLVENPERSREEPTADGVAYQIDTRLGRKARRGARGTPFEVFQRYLVTRAGIWERLAWTRCRFPA